MTDPFAELREYVESFNEKAEIPIAQVELSELLTDAAALLAVVPFARHKKECQIARAWGLGPGGTFTDPHCNCGFENAVAALPEHLRPTRVGESDDEDSKG